MLVALGSPGVHLITCNRCGKENQDHYKFCLGCGNELTRPAPAPSPSAGLGSDGPLETARTVLPPAPLGGMPAAMAATVSSGELRNSAGAAKPKGGIPWNDSPKMPAPVPFQLPPNPLAGPAPAPRVDRRRHPPGDHPRARRGRPAARPLAGELALPELRQAGPGRVRVLRRVRHAHRRGASGPQGTRRPAAHDVHGRCAAAAAPAAVPRGRLILIRPDGSEGGSHADS